MNKSAQAKLFLVSLTLFIFLSACISNPTVETPTIKNKSIECFTGYAKDTNLCFLDNNNEGYAFVTNCENPYPERFTQVLTVKDWPECKLAWAKKYNKIAPTFVPKNTDYPDYNKCNEKICLVCEYHCNVNPNLLDWRFNKLTHIYDKLAKLFGRTKLLDIPINYYIYSKELETESSVPIRGAIVPFIQRSVSDFWDQKAIVYSAEGINFGRYLSTNNKGPKNYEKILHSDYPDQIYAETFEEENTPAHEMLHAIFTVRYGSFGYNSIEENFTQSIGPIIGGWSEYDLNHFRTVFRTKVIPVFPNSFCDPRIEKIGYPKLYYLCKNYGFDVNDLPKLLDELDKIKSTSLTKNSDLNGKLLDQDFVKALSKVVDKDISKFWDNICSIQPDNPNCRNN